LSLQFHSRSGYFSTVPARVIRWGAVVLLAACGQRERLTFPTENPGNGRGPLSAFTVPDAADTTVSDGDLLIVQGRSTDPDGVDTVYFEVSGLGQSFAPLVGEGRDTVPWALQLSTINHSGATATVQVYAVDRLGDQGSIATRSIRIR
jgi:hypothetical protein